MKNHNKKHRQNLYLKVLNTPSRAKLECLKESETTYAEFIKRIFRIIWT